VDLHALGIDKALFAETIVLTKSGRAETKRDRHPDAQPARHAQRSLHVEAVAQCLKVREFSASE
jgi:hypothetical protein